MQKSKIILGLSFCSLHCLAQGDAKKIYEGNQLYHSGKIAPSTLYYKEALETNPSNRKANFNLGDALYKSAMDVKTGKMQVPVNDKMTPDSLAGLMFDKA